MKVTYLPIGPGHYYVELGGTTVAEIERTGGDDGWNSTWWWTSLQAGVTGLQTSTTLKGLKKLGETWLRDLETGSS